MHKVNVSIMEGYTRYNYADCIWFHIKQQKMEELSRDFVRICEIIYVMTFNSI